MDQDQLRRCRIILGLVVLITGLEMAYPPEGWRAIAAPEQPCGPKGCAVPRLEGRSVNEATAVALVPLARPLTTVPGLPAMPRPLASAIFALG